MTTNSKLSVPDPQEPQAQIDPQGFPAPFEDVDRTPPVTASEGPQADLRVTPATGTADIIEKMPTGRGYPFTSTEIQLALHLREQKLSCEEIGKRLNRSGEGVRRILEEWTPTADLAKATLRKGANTLADRVVAQADVAQALEVLDRLEVLPKRDRAVDNRVQVVLGVNIDGMNPRAIAVIDNIAEGETT